MPAPRRLLKNRPTGDLRLPGDGMLGASPAPRVPQHKASKSATTVKQTAQGAEISSPAHTATFDAHGFVFEAQESDGSPKAALGYLLKAVRRGKASLYEPERDGVGQVRCAPGSVHYARSAWLEERYLAYDHGIEQQFELAKIPAGKGDLVVEGSLSCGLEARPDGKGGLIFSDGKRDLLSLGKAVAYDAEGKVTDAPIRFEDGVYSISVPGKWLASAKAPIVIDPLISGNVQISDLVGNDVYPTIAFNGKRNEFLVVYSNAAQVLTGARIDHAGNVLSEVTLAGGSNYKLVPDVCWSEANVDNYLVSWVENSRVWIMVVDGELNTVSSAAQIYPVIGSYSQNSPDAAYDASRDRWLLVWDDNSASATQDIFGEMVDSDGTQNTTYWMRDGGGSISLYDPCVAYSDTSDRFLFFFNAGNDLWGVSLNGAITYHAFPTIVAANNQYESDVTWNSVANMWMVGYSSDQAALWTPQVYAQRVSPVTGALVGAATAYSTNGNYKQKVRVSAGGPGLNGWLVAWGEYVSTQYDVLARELNSTGGTLTASFLLNATNSNAQLSPDLARNTILNNWFGVWEDWRAGTDVDVWGQRYESFTVAPKVVRTTPQDDATDVYYGALSQPLVIEFSQDMNAATLTTSTIRLLQGGTPVGGSTVTYVSASKTVELTFSGNLPSSATLVLDVASTVANTAGVTLGATQQYTFTTSGVLGPLDTDGDGLLDSEEDAYGLNKNLSDTDSDGLSDWYELYVSFTDPTVADTDGDGTDDDVDATPLGTPADPIDPPALDDDGTFKVLAFSPEGGAVVDPATPTLSVVFSNPVNTASVTGSNVTLTDQTTMLTVALTVETSPSPYTLSVTPNTALISGRSYKLALTAGSGAIEDTDGTDLPVAADATVTAGSPAAGDAFEAYKYATALPFAQWETFPLTAPTASGRSGFAMVVPSTGKLLLQETDVSTPGRTIPVSITRTFRNNDAAIDGIFGKGWQFAYDQQFTRIASTNGDAYYELQHRTADGRLFTYLSSGGTVVGNYTSPAGYYDTLHKVTLNSQPHLKQRRGNGTSFYYAFHRPSSATFEDPNNLPSDAVGYLVQIEDKNCNKIVINRYGPTDATRPNLITTIVDDLDRTTTFTYSVTAGKEKLCEKVEQFTGAVTRNWTYSYDSNGCLSTASTPTSDWSDEGSPQTGVRKTRTYTYAASGSDYDLTSVQDGRGNTSMRFFYDANRDVNQVDYGTGSDAGTALYSFNRTGGDNVATQVDRNGNVSTIDHETGSSGFQTIEATSVVTKGLHNGLPGGEPGSYTCLVDTDSDGEVVQAVLPDGQVICWIREDDCGCPIQVIYKSEDYLTLLEFPNLGIENDILVQYELEPNFHQVIACIEPRGLNSEFVGGGLPIVAARENVANQTPRTFNGNLSTTLQEHYTTRYYYAHENVGTRTTAEGVSFARSFPPSYGRTGGGSFQDPPSSSIFGDNNSDGFPDCGGQLIAIRGAQPRAIKTSDGTLNTTRQAIEHNFSYNQYGQQYFKVSPDGDRSRVEWFQGAFNLGTNPNRGYLQKAITATAYLGGDLSTTTGLPTGPASGVGLDLTTTMTYDLFGNPLTIKNPRGFTSTIAVNNLNLVTSTTAAAPFSYSRTYTYDGNNNLVELAISNVVASDNNDNGIQDGALEQGTVIGKSTFTHEYAYNTANSLTETDMDAHGSSPDRLVTAYLYDARQQRIAVREPLGNMHISRYDERNLVYETIQGHTDSLSSQTTTYDYAPDGTLLQTIDDDGNSNADTTFAYDIFNRLITVTDEIGNKVEKRYDVASQLIQTWSQGQATGASAEPTTTYLAHTLYAYDEAGRPFQATHELWGAHATLASLSLTRYTAPIDFSSDRVNSGELVTSTAAYDVEGKVLVARDDNNHITTYTYDQADRVATVKDALSSTDTFTYDSNSNVIRVTESERSDSGLITETYYTERYYDELDRLIASVSHLGNATRYLYDSRNNVLQVSDANGAVSAQTLSSLPSAGEHGTFPQATATTPASTTSINERGNTVRYTYDGISRGLSKIEDLRVGGVGGGAVANNLTVSQSWDANSRVAARTDPKGNVTAYAYDHQNRLIRQLNADNTQRRLYWNRVDTLQSEADSRNVTKQYAYDAAERNTTVTVVGSPAGVGQTTFKAFQWDGLDRLTKAQDNDTITEIAYDSFSREISDTQRLGLGSPRTSSAQALNDELKGYMSRLYDGVGNLLRQWYPSDHNGTGSRTGTPITRTYDNVDRLASVVADSSTVATFNHIGQGSRRLSRTYPTPVVTQFSDYDGDRRVTRLDTRRTSDNQRIRGFAYAWDRVGNRHFERKLTVNTVKTEVNGSGHYYEYDSAYRLGYDQRAVSDAQLDLIANNTASPTTPTANPSTATSYTLDKSGNRKTVCRDGFTPIVYQQDSGAPTFDDPMNQISSVTQFSQSWRAHDAAGNVTSEGGVSQRFFDCDNQLVQWVQGSKDLRYRYDARGRRVSKTNTGTGTYSWIYFYDGWQNVEETTNAGALTKAYVYGEGIDEVLRASLPDAADLDADLNTTEVIDLYYHHNSLGSVVAVTDTSGNVAESYEYRAYGKVEIYDKTGSFVTATQVEQPFMFTGRRWDFEEASGLYYYRLRYYDPEAGRFVSRDPIGNWGDPSQRGNAQNYCGNNPVNRVDPMGLNSPTGNLFETLFGAPSKDFMTRRMREVWRGKFWKHVSKETGIPTDELKALFKRAEKYPSQVQSVLDHSKITDRTKQRWWKEAAEQAAKELKEKTKKEKKKKAKRAKKAKTIKKGGKAAKLLRKIPGLGVIVFLVMLPSQAEAKGLGGACLDGGLDAIPGVGVAKGIFELGTGKDVVPDKAGPSPTPGPPVRGLPPPSSPWQPSPAGGYSGGGISPVRWR